MKTVLIGTYAKTLLEPAFRARNTSDMTTLLITHAACLAHETPPGHPERSDRLRAVLQALKGEPFQNLVREEAPRASIEDVSRAHPRAHVEGLLARVPNQGFERIDGDTAMSPGSGEAALRAAGAVMHGVDQVMAGNVQNAFCAVRPPGHHAEPETAMGFCLFNNAAIAALYAREKHGLQKAAIVDFDVHHGNGTQAIFESDPDVLYISTHQSPLYPGTGGAQETGVGNILNLPLGEGTGGEAFRAVFTGEVLPALLTFSPDILFISAGFDAHADDPLAGLNFTEADYAWATQQLMGVASNVCNGRIVSTLEGGYDLEALAHSASAHVRALMGI